jgi:hypothetical protein
MLMPTKNWITGVAVVLWFSLLSGCGDPMIKTENPFRDSEQSIRIGYTTQTEVHRLLGSPSVRYPTGDWEVYKKLGDGIALIGIVPFPARKGWVHYLLITYDDKGRVAAVGTTADWASGKGTVYEAWSGSGVYAGDVGFYTGTNQPFISVDGGGKADTAWVDYLKVQLHFRRTGRTSMHIVVKYLCKASSLGHPSAFNAIGNIYKDRLYGFDQDNVRACFWHAIANNKLLPRWCDRILAPEELPRVKQLIEQWRPEQCKNEILPHFPEEH